MRTRALSSGWFFALCLLAGVVLRIGWILWIDARPVDDFAWYHERGAELAAGQGLQDHGRLTAYWPVGYPALLGALYAIFGPSVRVAQAANIVLSAGILAMAWLLGRRLTGSAAVGGLAAALLAVWPNQIAYSSLTATEIPFVFLLLLGLLLWTAPRWNAAVALATGVIFGLATLIRPQAALLPAFLAIWWWVAARRPRPSGRSLAAQAVLHLGLVAVLVPWTIRNHDVFGRFVFIANSGGINLLIGNNPRATGGYMEVPELLETRELERDLLAGRMAREYILGHPGGTLARYPAKLWHLYNKDVEGLYWNEMAIGQGEGAASQRPLWPVKLVAQGFWLAVLSCALIGLVLTARRGVPDPPGAALATTGWAVVAYFTLVFLALFGSSRFHFPMAPFLAIGATAWMAPAAEARRARVPAGARGGEARGVLAERSL